MRQRFTVDGLVLVGVVIAAWALGSPSVAQAGIPECGNLRLEDVRSCDIRGNVECSAGCDRLGVYKVNCATRLTNVCRTRCTLSAMPTCTDHCTEGCQRRCDAGENITCSHNCFRECEGSCTETCDGSEKPDQCMASCKATCDGECDVQCGPVVDASCYTHCIECCNGSCNAEANMDCQTSCQDETFEECEQELQVDCMASCSATGAIFCDDQFVISGDQIPTCANALIREGIAATDLRVEASASFDTTKGCSVGTPRGAATTGWLLLSALALMGLARRRRHSGRATGRPSRRR